MTKPPRVLSNSEIEQLLRPHGNVEHAYVVLKDGTKHYLKTRHVPTYLTGGFTTDKSGRRRYVEGSQEISGYKEGGST